MSELPPKREREENLKWVKWGAIFSGIAVLGTIFSGWMAYKGVLKSTETSIKTAELSLKLSKINELETRNYENKSVLYNSLIGLVNKIEGGSGNYNDLKTEIGKNELALEVYGSNTINQLVDCIYNGYRLIDKKGDLINNYDYAKDYQRRVLLPVLLLKKEIRSELNNYDDKLYKFDNPGLMSEFDDFLTSKEDLEYLINDCYSGGTNKIIRLSIKNKSGTGGKIITIYPK